MSIVPSLVEVLRSEPALHAVIGGRVHLVSAPEDAVRPFLVLVPSQEDDSYTLSGVAKYPETQFQVLCMTDDLETADRLGDMVIETLEDFSGTAVGRGLTVFREPINSYDHVPAQRLHRRIVGFRARHRAVA